MNKITHVLLLVLILATMLIGCENQKGISNNIESASANVMQTNTSKSEQNNLESEIVQNTKVNIQIEKRILTATLENNESVDALKKLIKDRGITIKFSEYGGFEQVGSIGSNLPRNDVQTTTSTGDIVLYSGNQLVLFYGPNSWAYTKIGKIDSLEDLRNILGNGDVTATFTLSE